MASTKLNLKNLSPSEATDLYMQYLGVTAFVGSIAKKLSAEEQETVWRIMQDFEKLTGIKMKEQDGRYSAEIP